MKSIAHIRKSGSSLVRAETGVQGGAAWTIQGGVKYSREAAAASV